MVHPKQSVGGFYDDLAEHYHAMFEDWQASMDRQSAALAPLLQPGARILDCACGIGTQMLGLAAKGFHLTGSDLSDKAITRARHESELRNFNIPLYVADMRDLSYIPEKDFDAVICMDNAIPHLPSDHDIELAVSQMRSKLKPGGLLMISIRDYDHAILERPVVHGPAFLPGRIVFQLWQWHDERHYTFHLYITRETEQGWQSWHKASAYRAIKRDELTAILTQAGYHEIRWLMPEETGFYQPIVTALS